MGIHDTPAALVDYTYLGEFPGGFDDLPPW
jgi:hypothetical protein